MTILPEIACISCDFQHDRTINYAMHTDASHRVIVAADINAGTA